MKKATKAVIALAAAAALTFGSAIGASACTGIYFGSELTENGSTFMGRSEDIGNEYNKIFEVHPAADHAEGEMYEDTYGFSMPYPSHTFRYTVVKDSPEAGETVMDENGNPVGEAYAEAGTNEKGVSVTATVSTSYNRAARAADPLVGTGICEISLASVILGQATSARHGVELLADIIDEHGSGECNSITISDQNEVWTFDTLSGYQYVAVKMPDDKISINPNMMIIDSVDVNDTENVVASPNLVSLPEEHGFLVTDENGNIDIAETYGSEDSGSGQYVRYWQGAHYVNPDLASTINVDYTYDDEGNRVVPEGPFDFLIDSDQKFSTLEILQILAYRGEGTKYDSNTTGCYAIGNPNQAECHVFEIREDMPEALSQLEWMALSRAEYSIYLPYYGSLLTDTSDIFAPTDMEFNEDSFYWIMATLNNTCDENRELYGTNVKKFWEGYQEKLIEQQAAVDADMIKVYEYSPKLAEQKATELAKAVSEEAYGYAKEMLNELQAFIEAGTEGEFVPTALTEGKGPTYSFDMVGGTGLPEEEEPSSPSSDVSSSDSSSSSSESSSSTANPPTGEASPLLAVMGLAAVAGATMVIVKKKEQK